MEKFKDVIKLNMISYFDRLEDAKTDQQRADAWLLLKAAISCYKEIAIIEGIEINNNQNKRKSE